MACLSFAHSQPPAWASKGRSPVFIKWRAFCSWGGSESRVPMQEVWIGKRVWDGAWQCPADRESRQRFCCSGHDSLPSLSLLTLIPARMWSLYQHINLFKAISIASSTAHWLSSSTLPYASSNSNQFISSQLMHLLRTHYVLGLVGSRQWRQIGEILSLRELITCWFDTVNVTTFNSKIWDKKLYKQDWNHQTTKEENLFAAFELS